MLIDSETKKLRKTFNDETERALTNSFKALGDANRHRIFQILIYHTSMSASDIAATLKISRPLASQHLKILEQAKLFKKEKAGQNIYYRLDVANPFVKTICKALKKYSP